MNKLLLTAVFLISHRVSGIKNSPNDATASTGELANPMDESVNGQPAFGEKYQPGHNRDDRISRPDRNFIITHEGIFNYQPVSRSLHNLDQEYKASSTFSRSEVIPVPNDGGHGISGGSVSNNALIQVQPGAATGLSSREAQAAYTSHEAVSVPLHVGFQVEDAPLPKNLRMNPKGKVLSLEGDSNVAANGNRVAYARRAGPRLPFSGRKQTAPQLSYQNNDMSLAESSNSPIMMYGQRVENPEPQRPTKLKSIYHQSPSHSMDQINSASSNYYRAVQPKQAHLNPYFYRINDLDNAASDPREAFDVYQNANLHTNENPSGNHHHKQMKDQSLDETKVYSDVNAGGAKSYVDYMTAGDLEAKKYVGGRYTGDVEDAGSGHYEGTVPIHFGFQVEHPRLQYPPKSSFADKYHADHHIPSPKSNKFKIPKVHKPSPAKYIPSVEDIDDEIDSDFKHIKIKKYSTNNEELSSIPSNYKPR